MVTTLICAYSRCLLCLTASIPSTVTSLLQSTLAYTYHDTMWRLGLVVARWSRLTKLPYAGPG